MIKRVKDGIKKVNNMSFADMVKYLQECHNNVSHLAIHFISLLFSNTFLMYVVHLHMKKLDPLARSPTLVNYYNSCLH